MRRMLIPSFVIRFQMQLCGCVGVASFCDYLLVGIYHSHYGYTYIHTRIYVHLYVFMYVSMGAYV